MLAIDATDLRQLYVSQARSRCGTKAVLGNGQWTGIAGQLAALIRALLRPANFRIGPSVTRSSLQSEPGKG